MLSLRRVTCLLFSWNVFGTRFRTTGRGIFFPRRTRIPPKFWHLIRTRIIYSRQSQIFHSGYRGTSFVGTCLAIKKSALFRKPDQPDAIHGYTGLRDTRPARIRNYHAFDAAFYEKLVSLRGTNDFLTFGNLHSWALWKICCSILIGIMIELRIIYNLWNVAKITRIHSCDNASLKNQYE